MTNLKEYSVGVERTKAKDYSGMLSRVEGSDMLDVLHGAIGASTEANELLDALKKHIFYGKELDVTNIKEEIGDLFYYIFVILNALDENAEEIMETNLEKLKARYPEGFTEDEAINRDLDKERKILETK